MEQTVLALAERYQEMGKPEAALEKLREVDLVLSNPEHMDHHILLSLVLSDLDRFEEGLELAGQLLAHFPDSVLCVAHWVNLAASQKKHAERAMDVAKACLAENPDDPWFTFIIAHIGYWFRLASREELLDLVDRSLTLARTKLTLTLACRVYRAFSADERYSLCLKELVELDPDGFDTTMLLLNDLYRRKEYAEALTLVRAALRNWPDSKILMTFEERIGLRAYGSRLDEVLGSAVDVFERFLSERQAVKKVDLLASYALILVGLLAMLAMTLGGFLLVGIQYFFFLHFNLIVREERKIKKYKSERLQITGENGEDELLSFPGSAIVLQSAPDALPRLVYIDNSHIALARNVWCEIERLYQGWDPDCLLGPVKIRLKDIRKIEVGGRMICISTRRYRQHVIHIESLKSHEFLSEQLARFGFSNIKHKKGSRLLVTFQSFLLAKIGFGVAFFALVSGSLFWAAVLALATVSNVAGFFFYRLFNPANTTVFEQAG